VKASVRQIAALRERIEVLEEENRQLRALRLPPVTQYLGLGLSNTERVVMATLMSTAALCTRDYLLDCVVLSRVRPSSVEPKTIDVMLCRARKKLAAIGFPRVIETEWGEGWRIKPKERGRLQAFFAARIGETK